MRVVLIGSVNSSRVTLSKLMQHGINVVAVLGLESDNDGRVSGHVSLRETAERGGIPFHAFTRINEQADTIIALQPDLIFVVGLSQLIAAPIIESATHGCVGFHPTKLPSGRGRAPLAWLTLDQGEGAATFFRIADGVDDGPIYAQQCFMVEAGDDARRVSEKIQTATEKVLDVWLPRLKAGDLQAIEQDHDKATYNGIRKPADGWLNWHSDPHELLQLIRSAARPHPGAYTYCGSEKIIIWNAVEEKEHACRGVVGRILHVTADKYPVVQTGHGGLLRIVDYEVTGQADFTLKVGDLLGYYDEAEIHDLKCQVRELLQRVTQLENQIARGR